ncbi:nucleotidyl transferase AbiEii/AbiGii toxin family protein [Paenibacillus kyungheensis]
MFLYEDRETFEQLVIITSEALRVPESIIEKDYYVSLLLKEISEQIPEIIFKGGTSLSKGYRLIERFSEDIDLSYFQEDHSLPTTGQLQSIKKGIIASTKTAKLSINNLDSIGSRYKHNTYEVSYNNLYTNDVLKDHVLIETSCHYAPYPSEKLEISNYIYNFLYKSQNLEVAQQFSELLPFTMNVQSLNRTFIDKCFALCDHYEQNIAIGFSRHLYDLYYIWDKVKHDQNTLLELYSLVKNDLAIDVLRNPSAADHYPFNLKLIEMVKSDFYKEDYNRQLIQLVNDPISYENIADALIEIFKQCSFDKI